MDDFDTLQDFEADSFPTLEAMLRLNGMTLEDLLKNSVRAVYSDSEPRKRLWHEEIRFAGLMVDVWVHSKSAYFSWDDLEKWTFHHGASKISPYPCYEVWVKD